MQALDKLIPKSPPQGYYNGKKIIKRLLRHMDALSSDSQRLLQFDDFYVKSRNLRNSRKPFPPVPPASEGSHMIDRYIANITSTSYGGKIYHNSRGSNTDVALNALVERGGLSPASIDLVLGHFARRGDPVAILALLQTLNHLTTQHFNHWVYSLSSQRRFNPHEFQFKSALPVLNAMAGESCVANAQTWNNLFLTMPNQFCLWSAYQGMREHGVPLSGESLRILTNYILSARGTDAVADIVRSHTDVPASLVHSAVEAILSGPKPNQENVVDAFDLVNYWASNGGVPTKTTLNIFLYQFAHRRRLDWMIGIAEYFRKEHNVNMTSRSWEHMIHAASKLNESPKKYQMVGLVFHEALKLALTDKSKTYLNLAFNFAEKNGFKVVFPGTHAYTYLKKNLSWVHSLGPPDYNSNLNAAKAAGAMGFTEEKSDVAMLEVPLEDVGIYPHRLWRGDYDHVFED